MPVIDTTPSDYTTAFGTITVTTTSYRVFQSSVAPGNIHWATPFQFQNEIHSFQIHATPSVNITSYTVTVGSLTNVQAGVTIATTTTDIVVYREWYIDVATPTALSTVTYSGGIRTWMPHQLIPAVDPYYHQTTNAFPVSITAGNTQSVWVDIHVPSSAPSGYYAGNAVISSGTTVISTLPIVVGVWSWVMPSSATLQMIGAGFGYNGFNNVAYNGATSCSYPNAGPTSNCDAANRYEWIDGANQMLDNKWGIDTPNYIYPDAGSFSLYISSIGPLLNGTTANITQTILPGAALGLAELTNSASPSAAIWQNWATNFSNQGWFSKLFTYFCDEATDGTLTNCISSMTASRSWSTPIVPNQTTIEMSAAITAGATNYIDWMTPIIEQLSPTSGDLRSTYNVWLATTSPSGVPRRMGSYDDCESAGTCGQGTIGPANLTPYPNYHIDGTAVANRAFQTALFQENVSYELYYAVDECDNTSGGYPCAGGGPDPWHVVYAFGNQGPGTMMTPSTTTITTTSSNIPIWCPTITLKYHRDGMDDYEMENYLTNRGYSSFVQTQIATWYTNPYTFSNNPALIDTARVAMGNKIHQLTYPPGGGSATESWSGQIKATGRITAQ